MSLLSKIKTSIWDKLVSPKFSLKFGIIEIDSTLAFFALGLLLGLIFFHNTKSLFVIFLFACFIGFIILHDLVQIGIAKAFSMKLRKFIIYPFGTKKFFGRDFDNEKQELLFAFCGIMVYFLLMILFVVLGLLVFKTLWPETIILQNTLTSQTLDFALIQYPLFFMFWISFLLFCFNLFILAMPMDGGRFVKAFLTLIFGQYSANKIVPVLSKVIAIIVVFAGLFFWDIIIILIGLFIYYTTVKELREYEILRVLEGKSVKSFMGPMELVFDSDTNVFDCFKEMKKSMNPDAVIKYEHGFGVVDVELISKINKTSWPTTKIGNVAKPVDYVTERENLAYVAQYMVAKDLEIIPVVDPSTKKVLGIIKRTEFSDYIKIHKIL